MQSVRHLVTLVATLVLSATWLAPVATADSLVEILPGLIPGVIFSGTESAQTVRPDLDNPGGTVADTGWVYGNFAPQADLGALSSSAFAEFQNLPVGSAVAAFTYQFDPDTNVFVKSDQGLGPIFADRAQTLGKYKLNVGVSWSHIDFDEIEGTNLNHIPLVTTPTGVYVDTYSDTSMGSFANQAHARTNTSEPNPYPAAGITYDVTDNGSYLAFVSTDTISNISDPTIAFLNAAGPEGEWMTRVAGPSDLEANVHLEVELINLYASFGILENVDIGIILPVLEIDMNAAVSYTSINTNTIAAITQAQLDSSAYAGLTAANINACQGILDPTAAARCIFDVGLSDIYNDNLTELMGGNPSDSLTAQRAYVDAVSLKQLMKDGGTSQGIGDLMIRGKWRFLECDYVDMAARLDMAFPTGSEKNFRSTGEYMWGGNLIVSKAFGWFAPHANLALQARTGGKENHQFRWMTGADVKLHERVAASIDFVGNEDLYHDGIGDTQMALATGLKVNPWANLVVSGAAVIRLNHQGLRDDIIPTLSVEYTFF